MVREIMLTRFGDEIYGELRRGPKGDQERRFYFRVWVLKIGGRKMD